MAVAVGMLVSDLGMRMSFETALPSFADGLQWYAQVVLCTTAYAAAGVLTVLMTRSEVAGIVAAFVLGGGFAERALQFVLANVPGLPSAVRDCVDGYLAADLFTLGNGVVSDPLTYAQAIVTIVVIGALCALVMRRKDIG